MTITALPSAPSRSDPPATFVAKADALMAALSQFVTEVNATASAINMTKWVTGTTYAVGDVTWSPIDFQAYRRKTAGAGTTDPSADSTNWQRTEVAGSSLQSQSYTAFTTGGTTGTFTLTPSPAITSYIAGQRFRVKFSAAGNSSDTLNISGLGAKSLKQYDETGAKVSPVIVSGMLTDVEYDGTDLVILDSLPIPRQIQPVTASVAGNALTLTLNPTTLDFRSATLTSGTVNSRVVSSAISVTVSSGSTLGTTNGVSARLALLAIDNAGTVELAVANLAGGLNLDETALISTTAEGGAGAADSASVIYSTTARTNVPFRVVGFVDVSEATAGTWASAPTVIQGAGAKERVNSILVSGTAANTTSGTSIDFTGIPTWAKRVTIMFSGVSTNGTSIVLVQLGTGSGIETTGYLGCATHSASTYNFSAGIGTGVDGAATYVRHGAIRFSLLNGNTYVAEGSLGYSDSGRAITIGGSKTLSGPLDRIRLTTVSGADTFDAGSINILYE